ncbi:ATP-binding protein [Candidatus Pantoea carbekii]|nr:hypothetical protein [Candidatus Pantoea carbekii]
MILRQGAFHFLEVNTHLQVEHAVTESVIKIDIIIDCMLQLTVCDTMDSKYLEKPHSVSIEARIYAENSIKNFQPNLVQVS